ncbi:hypothetical protein [Streptomyces sp. NPDC057877]|uniref:hypothetical protein n=1 Tax=Streptomyces sp. NPDC057877 TaxID=3346269 RepID=UPI003679EE6F
MFLSGDDDHATTEVTALLRSFGWVPDQVTDLGDLSSARAAEPLMPLWPRLYGVLGSADVTFPVATA